MAVPNQPSNNLVISRYLLKHCNLWVWDFDDTLIDTTTYYIKSMEADDIRKRTVKELDKEIPNWRYFKQVVSYLFANGYRVAIASFGVYEIIRAYMDLIFGFNQQYFTKSNIMASCKSERMSREYVMPRNKNVYVKDLMNFYNIQSYNSVVLFDDNPSNIADAGGIGMMTVQVAGRNQNELGSYVSFFNEDLMKNVDYKEGITCGGDLYMRNKISNLGDRKGPKMDKHMGVDDKYIYSDRIYVDQRAQRKRKQESEVQLKKQKIEQRKKRLRNANNRGGLIFKNEGFQNRWEKIISEPFSNIEDAKECNFCTTVVKDQYIWGLLVIFVLFMLYVMKIVLKK